LLLLLRLDSRGQSSSSSSRTVQVHSQLGRGVTSLAAQGLTQPHMPAIQQLALLLLLLLVLLLAAALTALVPQSLRAKVWLALRQHRGLDGLQPCQPYAAGWIGLLCCLLALLRRVRQVRISNKRYNTCRCQLCVWPLKFDEGVTATV
jgi:hypothetical protein